MWQSTVSMGVEVVPPRRPGSIRRTTSHDCTRPAGLDGAVAVVARGRDLLTGADGVATTVEEAEVHAEIDFVDGRILHIDAGLEPLVGTGAFSGFRRAAVELLPAAGGVLHQLVDDLPIAVMLSGRVPRQAGIPLGRPGRTPPIDLCAGWVEAGTLVRGFTELGPPLHLGPEVPPLGRDDDPLAWHGLDALPPRSTGRRRRMDVWADGDVVHVDAWFRDGHCHTDGVERVVHEYGVRADLDATGRVVACEATPGTLPGPECLGAVASAGRLVGGPLDGLRAWVTEALVGPTTCTHLNDALRALEGVRPLIEALDGQHLIARTMEERR